MTETATQTETKTAANVKQAVPFFLVSNIEASLRYYIDGLGFRMTNKWIDEGKLRWCWLELGGAALMLQEPGKDRVFVGNAMWVTSMSDPDGYKLDFESPTDAPEESEFSE